MWRNIDHHINRITYQDFMNLTAACNQLWAASSDTDQQCETDLQSSNQEATAKSTKQTEAHLKKVLERAL